MHVEKLYNQKNAKNGMRIDNKMKTKKELLKLREEIYEMYSDLHDLYVHYMPIKKWWGYKGDLRMAEKMLEHKSECRMQMKLIDWTLNTCMIELYEEDIKNLKECIIEWKNEIKEGGKK